jgi:hypothetical protein
MHNPKFVTVAEWLRDYPDYTREEAIEAVREHNAEVRAVEQRTRDEARTEARYEGSTFSRASR